MIPRQIEALPGQVIDDVFGIVGDAFRPVMVDDGYNVAVVGAAVDRAKFVFDKHYNPLFSPLVIAAFKTAKVFASY